MFFRVKSAGSYQYLQIVHSVRQGEKVRQQVPPLPQSGRKRHFVIDEKQIKAEERYDGIWVLRTNTVYNTETVAHVYKALWTVEDIFRTSKSILETRPIYHKRDETIRGHVFCSFLALVLKQELESRMKQAELEWEWKEVIRGLDALQQVEANFQADAFYFAASLAPTLRKQSAPRAWRYRPLCANSSDSVRAGNVVPRQFWHYVSPSTPTI
jgi:hypothetical protein